MPQNPKPYILLIEDNPDDELLTIRAIKNHIDKKYHIKVIRDSVEVIEALKQIQHSKDFPVMILLDLKLPKINGLELLSKIRALSGTFVFPIIVLTTSTQEEDIEESYRRGANAYVPKLVAFEAFDLTIKGTLDFWLNVNKTPQTQYTPNLSN